MVAMSAEKRDELKVAGNRLFKAQNYEDAMEYYSQAAEEAEGRELAVLLTNRAMARMRAGGAGAHADALADAQKALDADPSYSKAQFRAAQCLVQLGRLAEGVAALHKTFLLEPGDAEVHKLLMRHDPKYQKFNASLERMTASTDKKRADLKAMVSHGHPMTLRVAYYKTWMTRWTPQDREVALSQAFLEIVDKLKEDMKEHAKAQAIEQKERGEVHFGEDGMGVAKRMYELNDIISEEGFGLTSHCLEELVSERSYNEPALYCACVEAVSEGREDEPKWLPPDRKERLEAMRPTILFGTQAADASHPLRVWMCHQMAYQLRKQVLISCCLKVCMASAGVVQVQCAAMGELRNMRRAAKGLPSLKPGEEEEDDEILNKTDFEEYQERTMIDAQTAMDVVKHPTFKQGAKYDRIKGTEVKMLKDKKGETPAADEQKPPDAPADSGAPPAVEGEMEPGKLI
jgi:tetratricopeptide (TPR) repeat protein